MRQTVTRNHGNYDRARTRLLVELDAASKTLDTLLTPPASPEAFETWAKLAIDAAVTLATLSNAHTALILANHPTPAQPDQRFSLKRWAHDIAKQSFFAAPSITRSQRKRPLRDLLTVVEQQDTEV